MLVVILAAFAFLMAYLYLEVGYFGQLKLFWIIKAMFRLFPGSSFANN